METTTEVWASLLETQTLSLKKHDSGDGDVWCASLSPSNNLTSVQTAPKGAHSKATQRSKAVLFRAAQCLVPKGSELVGSSYSYHCVCLIQGCLHTSGSGEESPQEQQQVLAFSPQEVI